jgi:hypothetical protein
MLQLTAIYCSRSQIDQLYVRILSDSSLLSPFFCHLEDANFLSVEVVTR